MAVITYEQYYPDIGKMWPDIVTLWTSYVQVDTLSWSTGLTTVSGRRVLGVTIDDGTDQTTYNFWDLAMAATQKYRAVDMVNLPGWMTPPPVMLSVYGSRVTSIDYTTTLWALRAFFYTWYCSASVAVNAAHTYAVSPPGANAFMKYIVWDEQFANGVDFLTLAVFDRTANAGFPGDVNPTAGARTPSVPVIGGSTGKQIDLAPVVAALNEIALIDVDYTANNGGAVWSMRGKVRTP